MWKDPDYSSSCLEFLLWLPFSMGLQAVNDNKPFLPWIAFGCDVLHSHKSKLNQGGIRESFQYWCWSSKPLKRARCSFVPWWSPCWEAFRNLPWAQQNADAGNTIKGRRVNSAQLEMTSLQGEAVLRWWGWGEGMHPNMFWNRMPDSAEQVQKPWLQRRVFIYFISESINK